MNRKLELLGYIFFLGLSTYAWWKVTSGIKRRMDYLEREGQNTR